MASIRFVCVSFAVLVAAGSAHAQTAPGRRIDVAVTGGVTFDDNVARASEQRARQTGLVAEDLVFRPAVSVDVFLPLGGQSLALRGSAGYDIHARNTRLDRERVQLGSTLGLRFGRCDGSVNGVFRRQQTDLSNLAFGNPFLVGNQVRNTETFTTVTGSLACGSRIGFRPTGSVTQSFGRNSNNFYRFSNFDSTSVTAGVEYSGPGFGTLTVYGGYTNSNYPNRRFLLGPGRDGFETKTISARLQRQIGARLSGSIEGGYTDVSSKRAGSRGFSGLTASADLVARVNDRLQVSGALARQVNASNVLGAEYVISRLISLGASYAVSERMTVDAGAAWNARDLRGSPLLAIPTIGDDRTSTIHAGVRYGFPRRLQLSVRAERARRNADFDVFDYTSNRAIVSARLGL